MLLSPLTKNKKTGINHCDADSESMLKRGGGKKEGETRRVDSCFSIFESKFSELLPRLVL